MKEERDEFAAYNSMAREPLIFGVPIIPLVIISALILLTFALGLFIFGITGLLQALIVPIILAIVLFLIRMKCEDDTRAINVFLWDLKGLILRVSSGSFIVSFTSTFDSNARRAGEINEWFKNIRDSRKDTKI